MDNFFNWFCKDQQLQLNSGVQRATAAVAAAAAAAVRGALNMRTILRTIAGKTQTEPGVYPHPLYLST